MILDAANVQCLHAIVPRNATDIGSKTYLQIVLDEGATALGAENAMEKAAGEGMAHDDFSADYGQSSLRD